MATAATQDPCKPIIAFRYAAAERTNFIENIIPACARCNQRKGEATKTEFRERLAREQILRPPEL